jgi:LPS-assembly protein
VQIVVSPYGGRVNDVPNEDSASFEFDDTNLFSANKLPGYDLIESGPRANVGVRYGLYGPRGSAIDFLIGGNLRLKEQSVFDRSTGLGDQQSDFVGRLRVSPGRYFDFIHRFRIDREDLSFNRNEFTGQVGTTDYWARASYVQLSEGLTASGLEPREEFAGSTRLKLWENWYFEASARRDLVRNKMISSGGGLVFSNECAEVAFQYKRRFTRDRELQPSSSFTVRIRLKTFGESSGP